jgi:alanine racemase
MISPSRAVIDLAALDHNLGIAQQNAPNSKTMAVIKANGYGHGIERVARALRLADAFAVARMEEALCLREAGIEQPILLLGGVLEASELALCVQHNLHIVVHVPEQLHMLLQARLEKPLTVWLKVDTGMHRLGMAPDRFHETWQALQESEQVADDIVVMTHFANADDPNDSYTSQQLQTFNTLTKSLDAMTSMANSAAILLNQQTHKDWIRPGIMLYGASPVLGATASNHGLKPVMTLESQLIAVNTRKQGEKIGYGHTWTCPEEMPIGVVAIGYGDGYPRHIKSGTPVLVNGIRCEIIGRVSMDMITVDLRPVKNARAGDRVVLWGEGLPAEEIALQAETIAYELFCQVTPRVKFIEKTE